MLKPMLRKTLALLLALCALSATVSCSHTHTWQEASCETAFHCTECGESSGEPLGHTWVEGARCTDDTVCSTCGEVMPNTGGAHAWVEWDCENPKTCTDCGATEGEAQGHFWRSATCELPQTCDRCGATKGEPRGHMPTEATCTQKSVCKICESVRSVARGHQWAGATCTEGARCTVCNALGNKADHQYEGEQMCGQQRKCTVCGQPEALITHQWGTDGRCTRCHTTLTLDMIQELVSFHSANCGAVMKLSGKAVYVRTLWIESKAPFDVIIQENTLLARGAGAVWRFEPYEHTITPALGMKASKVEWVGPFNNDTAILITPKQVQGSVLSCLVIDGSTVRESYANCTFEMKVRVANHTYYVTVSDQGDVWTLLS
ncbi:MAG: hypothetical protein J6R04_03905 [Clostridia bacterium]|nr:hypothetical protein [Clostridia bacterium]